MNEFQDDSLDQRIEQEESDLKPRMESKKEERYLLGHRSRKPFLFLLSFLAGFMVLATAIFVGDRFMANSIKDTTAQDVAATEVNNPEIRDYADSESVQKGELMTDDNDEQERLNALAEESRVYCIISSAPYFADSNSKGSLSISNPKESNYYSQVVIKTDEGKEMYVSPLLAPDESIESDYLTSKDFEPGSYHCYAYFNYYSSEESSSYLGSMCAEINIMID